MSKLKTELKISSNIHVLLAKHQGRNAYVYVCCFAWDSSNSSVGSVKPSSNELKQTQIGHQDKAIYVNTAAQITLVKAQDKAENELKYPCSDEEHQHRHTYGSVFCFAWDNSNSNGEGSKPSSD